MIHNDSDDDVCFYILDNTVFSDKVKTRALQIV